MSIQHTQRKNFIIDQDGASDFVSEPIYLGNVEHTSIQVSLAGTLAGDLSLEVSNGINMDANNLPTDWEFLPDSAQTIAAPTNHVWLDSNTPYLWVRVKYVATSGAGLVNGIAVLKGSRSCL